MSRNWGKDDPIADAHDHANRDMPSRGRCTVCNKDIYTWETYYQIEDELIHDECIYDWIGQFRKYP